MSDALLAERKKYTPPAASLRLQGKNRYMARVHVLEEVKTASEIILIEQAQDRVWTGDIVALSPVIDRELFPDLEVGKCVKVFRNGWQEEPIDGVLYAVGDAQSVMAVYDPNQVCQE